VSETIQNDPPAVAPATPAKGGNGLAIAGFITGLIGLIPLGLIFGIIGLIKAKRVSGKVLAILGIVFALAWIVPVAIVTPHLIKASDPGCQAAQKVSNAYPDSKIQADSNDPAAFGADLQAIYAGLTDAASKANNADAKAALTTYANDYGTLLQALSSGQQPAADLEAKMTSDEDKANSACGKF
jgi:predicted lipid-binding transport protein (Tim44 family)